MRSIARTTPVVLILTIMITPVAGVADDGAAGESFAGLSIEDLMKINISVASLNEESILDTPSMVTVIDRQMIQEYNFQSVAEALNLVPGMSVLRTYLMRDLPTARGVLQDHYANKVLVLINDIPTWMGVTGEGSLHRIDIHDVERIEVLKGPASVLYGTNAYSGAINIVLRDSIETRPGLQMGIAENMGFRAGGHYVADLGVKLFLSANAVDDIGQDFTFTDEGGNVGLVDQYVNTRNFTGQVASEHHSAMVNAYTVDESYLGVTPNFSSGAGKNHLFEGFLANYTYSTGIGDAIDVALHLRRPLHLRLDDIGAGLGGPEVNVRTAALSRRGNLGLAVGEGPTRGRELHRGAVSGRAAVVVHQRLNCHDGVDEGIQVARRQGGDRPLLGRGGGIARRRGAVAGARGS